MFATKVFEYHLIYSINKKFITFCHLVYLVYPDHELHEILVMKKLVWNTTKNRLAPKFIGILKLLKMPNIGLVE